MAIHFSPRPLVPVPRGPAERAAPFVVAAAEPRSGLRGTPDRNGGHRDVPLGFGILADLVRSPRTSDVFVAGDGGVWCDAGGGCERVPDLVLPPDSARRLATGLIGLGGRHIDEATPCADVRLADGIRVHAVLPPVSTGGALISIRLPRIRRLDLDDLDADGFFDGFGRAAILRHVENRTNILVTGAGGSGKTTLLGALLAAASPTERIVTLEDVAELRIDHPHVISLESRQPNLEGAGEVDLARLVRESLRMRPDRLVVGECRGAEIRELLSALNTGHDGGAGTLHANRLDAVPARLEALGALAGLGPEALARQAVSAFGLVLHVERVDGRRRLAALGTLVLDSSDRLAIQARTGAEDARA